MASGATSPMGSYNASSGAVVQGARIRSDVAAARRVIQYTNGVVINSNITPILLASEKIKKGGTVGDYVSQHNEYDVTPGIVTLDDGTGGLGSGSGYNSSDTTLTVASGQGSRVVVYDTLKYLPTGEIMWVTARSGDNITVTRGFTASANTTNVSASYAGGGAAGAAIPANAELQILKPVFPQGSLPPEAQSTDPLIVYTILQCSRWAVKGTGRLIASMNYNKAGKSAVDEWQRIHDAVLEKMNRSDETSLLHNQGTADIDNLTYGSMTDGIPSRILTNRFNVPGALDEVTLENYAISLYRYSQGKSENTLTFIGENIVRTVDLFARDNMRYTTSDDVLGSKVKKWRCTAGDLNFTRHGMFGPTSSSQTAAQGAPIGWMLSINFDNVEMLTFAGRGLRYEPDVATPGYDGKVGCWIMDKGVKMMNERTHGFMYGVNGLAA